MLAQVRSRLGLVKDPEVLESNAEGYALRLNAANPSGYVGVAISIDGKSFEAHATHGGVKHVFGTFDSHHSP